MPSQGEVDDESMAALGKQGASVLSAIEAAAPEPAALPEEVAPPTLSRKESTAAEVVEAVETGMVEINDDLDSDDGEVLDAAEQVHSSPPLLLHPPCR